MRTMSLNFKVIALIVLALIIISVTAGTVYWFKYRPHPLSGYSGLDLPLNDVSYEGVVPDTLDIKVLADKLGTVTRIKISPDGQEMFVTELSGTVWIFTKQNETFVKQATPFYQITTGFTGFPVENGLTGLALGADYQQSGDVFLLYAIDLGGEQGTRNRITRVHKRYDLFGNIVGTDPVDIFESNARPNGAHQIQDGLGVMIEGTPHLLFVLGENYRPEDSKNLTKEAGKFMLIQRDGSDPLGERPYPDYPKICAKGIRNSYSFDLDPNDQYGRVLIGDNGASSNDRLVYAKLIDKNGGMAGGLDFGWIGEDSLLVTPVIDTNVSTAPNTILHIWDETISPDGVLFYPGNGIVPPSNDQVSYALILQFGSTGTNDNSKGKQILLAKIENRDTQPVVTFEPLIRRKESATSHPGNPLGLTYDPTTLKVYFGDAVEGRVYEVDFQAR